MTRSLLDEITGMCNGIVHFYETLEDILFDNQVAKGTLAECMGWKPQIVSRLMDNQLPNWLALDVVRQIALCVGCDAIQEVRLIDAFICELLRRRNVITQG